MKSALLLINPTAGKNKPKAGLFALEKLLSEGDILAASYFTRKGGDAAARVRQLAPAFDLVICCGGDGTLSETVNGLLSLPEEDRRPIGYIPCGTTNDYAATLGIPTKVEKAAAMITAGHTRRIDVGHFNERYFHYVASFGAFTNVSYETPQQVKNSFGHFAYILEAATALGTLRPHELSYRCDGESGRGVFLFGAVSNTTSIGGIYKLPKKEVALDDGKLELVLLREKAGNPETLWRLIQHQLHDDENIVFLHGKQITLRAKEAIPYTLDGEFGGEETLATISCHPSAIEIFC